MEGTKQVAQRMVNAEARFVEVLMNLANISQPDAIKAMRTMLKLKVAKLDPIMGEIKVKHGAFLDKSAILNAVKF